MIGEIDQRVVHLFDRRIDRRRELAARWAEVSNLHGRLRVDTVNESICRGADRVYVVSIERDIRRETITAVATEVCRKVDPSLPDRPTDLGRDLAPAAARRRGIVRGLHEWPTSAQNVFVQTRPVYGGKAMAVFSSTSGKLQIDTIRPKSMKPLEYGGIAAGEKVVVADDIRIQDKVRLTKCEKSQEEGIPLEEAKVIVAGGGGLGGAKGFDILTELAHVLNAAVGATRVPVDEKWVPQHMEIGQTGKIVTPALYIAIGISGATQHITGILGSGKIVAINKDPDANIFRVADFGLVADYKDAVPVLIEKLKGKAA